MVVISATLGHLKVAGISTLSYLHLICMTQMDPAERVQTKHPQWKLQSWVAAAMLEQLMRARVHIYSR